MVSTRLARESDLDRLTELWDISARSSHTFASEEDFQTLRPWIRDHMLPSMDVIMAVEDDDVLGFVGARDAHVELLYVDPAHHGRGIGSDLLGLVDDGRGATSVQVYAENDQGMSFYRSQGFVETRRHASDDLGRPFPVAHLERRDRA